MQRIRDVLIVMLFFSIPFICFGKAFFFDIAKENSLVKTKEDKERMEILQKASLGNEASGKIPKKLLFFYLKSQPLDKLQIHNIKGWIKQHPDWDVEFWTEDKKHAPKFITTKLLKDVSLPFYKIFSEMTENIAERKELLKYEVLYKEGGFAIDVDARVQDLTNACSFPYALQPAFIHKPLLGSSVQLSTQIIGCEKNAALFEEIIQRVKQDFSLYSQTFLGKERGDYYYRYYYRTFLPFETVFLHHMQKGISVNMLFPSVLEESSSYLKKYVSLKGDQGDMLKHYSCKLFRKIHLIEGALLFVIGGFLFAIAFIVVEIWRKRSSKSLFSK